MGCPQDLNAHGRSTLPRSTGFASISCLQPGRIYMRSRLTASGTVNPLSPPIEIIIKSDDADAALKAVDEVERYGFKNPHIEHVDDGACGSGGGMIGVDPGSLGQRENSDIFVIRLLAAAGFAAEQSGVDLNVIPPDCFLPAPIRRRSTCQSRRASRVSSRLMRGLFRSDSVSDFSRTIGAPLRR